MGGWTAVGGRAGILLAAVAAMCLAPGAARAQCSSTSAITCGETKSGALSATGEVDCFTFDAAAGETVSITTQETGGVFQACWRLTGPSGSITGFCGQGERTLPLAGTYTIEVFDSGDDQTGTYDVNLVVVSDTAGNCSESIACGATPARSIALVGESDGFGFDGAAGETLSITAQETGGGLAACWELYDPNGLSLGGVCGQSERTLAVAGLHTIRVFDQNDASTGTYDLSVVVVSDTASNCGQAITCGDTLGQSVGSVGESDSYRFAAQAGETVSITAQETAGGLSACWQLYDPTGLPIQSACGQQEKPLSATGNYTIRVYDNDDKETGTYDVNLVFVSDTPSNCAEGIACGNTLGRSVDDVGQSNTYRFTAAAGETVSITAQQTSAFLDACWELYDPDGISVTGACGQAEKTLAVPGDYTIRVYDNGDAETGTYDVNLVFVSDTASNCAAPVLCGQTLEQTIASTGESRTYRFAAVAGEAISVTAQETGGFISACWELYDPQGISLGGTCGQLEKTLAVQGGYTIRVYDNNDVETGSYDLNLVVVSDSAHNCAAPIACGDVRTGTLDLRGESDTFRVDGALIGGDALVDTEPTGGQTTPCWELYDPTGASLGGTCGDDQRTFAFAGTYTVRVYDQRETDTGSYTLTLCTPTSTTVPGGTTTTTTTLPQLLSGRRMRLKDAIGQPQKRRLLVLSKDAGVALGLGAGTADDPTIGGGTLRILTAAGDRFDTTYPLPPAGWRPLSRRDPSKGWRFRHGDALKLALVKQGRQLKLVGRGSALGHSLESNPDPVGVELTIGTRRFCLAFGGATSFTAGKSFLATDAPAPAQCPGAGG